MTLSGKVAVITGSSMGIGEAIAKLFADEGASVVVLSRDAARAESARQRIGHADRTLALSCDVRNREEIDRVLGLALHHFQHIDIWVNNAGSWSARFRRPRRSRRLSRNFRYQFLWRAPGHAGRDSGDEAAGRRRDHQYLQRRRARSVAFSRHLQRHKVCHERVRQGGAGRTEDSPAFRC